MRALLSIGTVARPVAAHYRIAGRTLDCLPEIAPPPGMCTAVVYAAGAPARTAASFSGLVDERRDVDLQEYLRIIAKQWWLILLAGLLGLAVSLGFALSTAKVYTAGAQIFVATASATDVLQLAQGNTFTEARVQSYVSIADSPAVTDPVVRELGLGISSAQLARQISASAPENTVLINIRVRSGSPEEAARLANAVATRFTRVVADLEDTARSGRSPVKLTVTHPATPPVGPTSPRLSL